MKKINLVSKLLVYKLIIMKTTRKQSDLNGMILFLYFLWKLRTDAKDSKTGAVIASREEKMIRKTAVIANLAQSIIRNIWIQAKPKPTEDIQFSVKEMIYIFRRTITRSKEEINLFTRNLSKEFIEIMIKKSKD